MERSWLLTASLLTVGCASAREAPYVEDTLAVEDTEAAVDTARPIDAPLTYPTGDIGLDMKGRTFPRLTFQGYAGGEGGTWRTIDTLEYYDPTGERGIYAVVIMSCTKWCGPCSVMSKDLPKFYTDLYKGRGARFLYVLMEDKDTTTPATIETADDWNARFHFNFDLGIDPEHASMPATGAGIPRIYIIDPRTMKIVRINSGIDPTYIGIPGLGPLLDYNHAPGLTDAGVDGG